MSAKAGWIDFRALCKSVEFRNVLGLYQVELNIKGDRAQGFCPLPMHRNSKQSASFSAELKRGIWQCFSCGGKGNILDFVARMEGLDPFRGKDIRKAAELLQEKLGLASESVPPRAERRGDRKDSNERNASKTKTSTRIESVLVNAPLDFELKDLDAHHPYLRDRGLLPETIRTFGLGFCNRGAFKGRIAIPIHNGGGELVGYAGRLIDDRAISGDNPKYKLPPSRERNNQSFNFDPTALLYNAHRVPKRVAGIIIVQGFTSVWWLHQHGYRNTVALMGEACSDEQAKLLLELVDRNGTAWLMPNGDEAGRCCAERLLTMLSPYRYVRWAKLKNGEQPSHCPIDDLQAMLDS